MHQLKVNQQQTIVALYQQGWSKRRIARELGVDRSAVRRYLAAADSKPPTNPQTGNLHLSGFSPESLCEPWKERIEARWRRACPSSASIRNRVANELFAGSYDSV